MGRHFLSACRSIITGIVLLAISLFPACRGASPLISVEKAGEKEAAAAVEEALEQAELRAAKGAPAEGVLALGGNKALSVIDSNPLGINSSDQVKSLVDNKLFKEGKPLIAIFDAYPTNNDEFRNIFSQEPSIAQLKKLQSNYERSTLLYKQLDLASNYSVRSLEDFVSLVRDPTYKIQVIIGHNRNGEFYFGDGKSMSLKLMALKLSRENKIGIILSCETESYIRNFPTTSKRITYEHALKIISEIPKILANVGKEYEDNMKNYSRETQVSSGDKVVTSEKPTLLDSFQSLISHVELQPGIALRFNQIGAGSYRADFSSLSYIVKLEPSILIVTVVAATSSGDKSRSKSKNKKDR